MTPEEARFTIDPEWYCPDCKSVNAGFREICRVCRFDTALTSGGAYFPIAPTVLSKEGGVI